MRKKYKNPKVITTIEISEMTGIRHSKILEKIDGNKNVKGIIPELKKEQYDVEDYFRETTYMGIPGKYIKCYHVTQMGCDLLSNRFAKNTATAFKAKYLNRFIHYYDKPSVLDEPKVRDEEEIEEVIETIPNVEDMTEKDTPISSNIQLFKNEEFGEIRTVMIDGEPWFVGKDVAKILGYSNTRKALADHVDEEDKMDGVTIRDSIGREQNPICINESGLYSLILSSKKSNVKRFKRWVTSEVLPAIRKDGGYFLGEKQMSDDELLAKALTVAMTKIEAKDQQIKQLSAAVIEKDNHISEMKPKIDFYDRVSDMSEVISIGKMAALIDKEQDYKISQTILFEYLRRKGYLCSALYAWNKPSQLMIDKGYMTYNEFDRTVWNPGSRSYEHEITFTPKITGKGQQFIVKMVLRDKELIQNMKNDYEEED